MLPAASHQRGSSSARRRPARTRRERRWPPAPITLGPVKPFRAGQSGRDDAALIEEAPGLTVASTDTFVEGVHFDLGWMSGEDAGWRSLALALGDLAAKGAMPSWALTSVALPRSWQVETL